MKRWLVAVVIIMGFNGIVFGQSSPQSSIPRGRFTQESQHYYIESDLELSQNNAVATLLETGFQLYDQYFNSPSLDWPLRVRIFANRDAYLAALATFPAEFNLADREDFLFLLNGRRPEMSVLFIYLQADEARMQASLLKNGFLQYVFAVAPEIPSWLREGLALYFELATLADDGKSFSVAENHLYLDRLQLVREESPITLSTLLSMDDEGFENNLESALAHAWAVVNYLMTEQHDAMINIITTAKDNPASANNLVMQYDTEIEAYFHRDGFNALMSKGRTSIESRSYEEAFEYFTQASKVIPHAWSAQYYLGLSQFHLEQYDEAITLYNNALRMGAPEALIDYALGMVFMARDDFAVAEFYFASAEEKDRTRFGRHVTEQRQKMESKQILQ